MTGLCSTVTSPDPALTANIYASGRVDDLIANAIAPFWHEARTRGYSADLWVVRYRLRGEHLKVRLHCGVEDRNDLQRMLTQRTEGYFTGMCSLDPTLLQIVGTRGPAIDLEDEVPAAAHDRSLVWTTYRRSHVSLPSPWLIHDDFAAHACACLARGFELVLSTFRTYPETVAKVREKVLIQAFLAALRSLRLDERDRALEYVRYHRNWLLRFFLQASQDAQQATNVFNQQIREQAGSVDRLRYFIGHRLLPGCPSSQEMVKWADALASLVRYIEPFCGRPEYDVDPYASDVTFLPIFKVLHGVANQFGLPPLQEAYVYQLMSAALMPEGEREPAPCTETGRP